MDLKLISLIVILLMTGASAHSEDAAAPYPRETRVSYEDPTGIKHTYLVQEPAAKPDKPALLIYMHGAGGFEEQGMDPEKGSKTWGRLRALMAKWNWVYVCPRDYEFAGLLKDFEKQYHPSAIYLSGASAGGRAIFNEVMKNPTPYAGLFLSSPAVLYPPQGRINVDRLTMPIWITAGEKDDQIVHFSRELAQDLEHAKKRHVYVEIPGGDHNAPTNHADWEKALQFLIATQPVNVEDALNRGL